MVFKGVPARVCTNCGEGYVDKKIAASLLKSAAKAARSGIQVEIRQFSARDRCWNCLWCFGDRSS
ncbi:MAG: YgiT-type zinc finger protein [Candidatus Binatia bacterium]